MIFDCAKHSTVLQISPSAHRADPAYSKVPYHCHTCSGIVLRERLDGSCTVPEPVLEPLPNSAPVKAATDVGVFKASVELEIRRAILPTNVPSLV